MTDKELLIARIRKGKTDYEADLDAQIVSVGAYYVQFQDRNKESLDLNWGGRSKTSSNTWARVWKNGKLIFHTEAQMYVARQKVIKFLQEA